MDKAKKQKLISVLLVAAVTLAAFFASYLQVLFPLDKMITDPLYQRPSVANKNIKVIAIDEKTIAAYGDMKTWDRGIWADLIEKLNSGEKDPAVIVLDIMFIGTTDEASDAAFAAAAAEGNNVITAVNCIYKTEVGRSENGIVKKTRVQMVEFPYDRLKEVSGYGFSNAMQDKDGYIRFAETVAEYNGEKIDSLAVAAYKRYCEVYGLEVKLPKTYLGNRFDFAFAGKSGAYGHVSMCDVLDGTREAKEFAGSIVMVGAYAPGMQDAYNVAIQRGSQMYGVEIHANIIEALLEGNTAVEGNRFVYAVCVAAVCLAFCLLVGKMKVTQAAYVLAGICVADVAAGMVLYRLGITIGMVDIPVFMLLIYGVNLGKGYLAERLRRRKVMAAFKKYMEPQIVDALCKDGEFHLTLGGESREVAVLFVDIRGFTPMSESLAPEQVVGILNEYLALTTQAIFNNKGTLDKFIGDAAMAIFNAPVDLEDYVYHAVCAARDIAAGSEVLQKKLMEKFGKSISFGIGVNCGRAVVGNIGCEFRMDYTAIGDTVNTAARLESNAKPGQILISSDVYEAVKDRVEVTEVGVIPLKGKSNGIFVYQVDKVL
ncbi:MAG: adenylate/guanylate cyclase domain-containing protein [Lachnospiraceae bacterium]|nr:adenylate/guanylate cyclase domain-containing protein [Lachnospiraceae bacterium]